MMADAAYRKALQETGLRCFVGPIIYTAETIFPDGPKGIPVHSINSCFLLVPKNETHVYLDNHSSSYRWTQNIQNSLHPYVKECLKGAGLK